MPIHEYPFVVLQKGSMPRPMLPIRIVNPDTGIAVPAWGMIDTGADDCAIPAKNASMLGHNLQLGRERRVGTGNGVTIAYAHTTNIEILKVEGDTVLENVVVEKVIATPIDYMPNLDTILLGADNFLNRFVLEINYPRYCFSTGADGKGGIEPVVVRVTHNSMDVPLFLSFSLSGGRNG